MGTQEKKQALEQAAQYNQTLVSDAGRFNPSEEQDALYKSLLNADGTGMMGYITIPEIKCKLALYHTVDDSVLQVGIGHLEGSSLPVGGTGTHCVLSGHRGLPSAKLFTDLDKLQKGDVFLLHIYDQVFTYEIDQIRIVDDSRITSDAAKMNTVVVATGIAIPLLVISFIAVDISTRRSGKKRKKKSNHTK